MPTPRLPVETIEHILSYVFQSSLPLSTPDDFLPITPPSSTPHLLLVSKRIRAISLPLFYRSITILRSHDYFALWDLKTVLFAGERGKEIASFVQEIKINLAATARLPVDLPHASSFYGRGKEADRVLVPLLEVPLPRLKHLCFFLSGTEWAADQEEDYEVERVEREAGRLLAGDEDLKDASAELDELHEQERLEYGLEGLEGDELEEELQRQSEQDPHFVEEWYEDRQEALDLERQQTLHRLVGSPPSVAMPINTSAPSVYQPPRRSLPITLHPSPTNNFSTYYYTKSDLPTFMCYNFIGVPPSHRARIVEAIKRDESQPRRDRWFWINEDGTSSPFMG